jgi:zinc/manganese transport system permease protein
LNNDLAWLAAPVSALAISCVLLVPLGAQVLRRGVVFIDLAIAQVAACGALAIGILTEHPSALQHALSTALAALAGAALVRWLAYRWPQQREALIGLVYVAAASASLLAAAYDVHGRERLAALLAADVLWAEWRGIAWLGVAAAAVALFGAKRRWLEKDALFYPTFALALSVAVPVLGLYVVFALLIGPALWCKRGIHLATAVLLASGVCAIGLLASVLLDWPSGACVALALCLLGASTAIVAPRVVQAGVSDGGSGVPGA